MNMNHVRQISHNHRVSILVVCSFVVMGIVGWWMFTPHHVKLTKLKTEATSNTSSLRVLKSLPGGQDPDVVFRATYILLNTLPLNGKYTGGKLIYVDVHPLNESDIHPKDSFAFVQYHGQLRYLPKMSIIDPTDFNLLDETKFTVDPDYFFVEQLN